MKISSVFVARVCNNLKKSCEFLYETRDEYLLFLQSNDSSEEAMQRSNITADPSPSDITTDNENKLNSSEEAWTDVNLNEDGDNLPITDPREDPRNIHNIAHAHGKSREKHCNRHVFTQKQLTLMGCFMG